MLEKPKPLYDSYHQIEALKIREVERGQCKEKKYQARQDRFVLEFGLLHRTNADSSECRYVHKSQSGLVKNVHDAVTTPSVYGIDEYRSGGEYAEERHAVLTLAVSQEVSLTSLFKNIDSVLEEQQLCLSEHALRCEGIIHEAHALESYVVTRARLPLHEQQKEIQDIERFMRQYSALFVQECDRRANFYARLAIVSKPLL